MKKLKPPVQDYNNSYNNPSTSSSRLRPPMSNNNQSNNNVNNTPFPSSRPGPQFSNPNKYNQAQTTSTNNSQNKQLFPNLHFKIKNYSY